MYFSTLRLWCWSLHGASGRPGDAPCACHRLLGAAFPGCLHLALEANPKQASTLSHGHEFGAHGEGGFTPGTGRWWVWMNGSLVLGLPLRLLIQYSLAPLPLGELQCCQREEAELRVVWRGRSPLGRLRGGQRIGAAAEDKQRLWSRNETPSKSVESRCQVRVSKRDFNT